MEDRYVNSDKNKKILNVDATNLYDHSMSQMFLMIKLRCGMVILMYI